MCPRHDDPRWQRVLDELREGLTEAQFETWFTRIRFKMDAGSRVLVLVPNRFYADWLEAHYRATIEETVGRTLGFRPELTIEIEPGTEETAAAADDDAGVEPYPALHHRSRFERFVIGRCNRLAFEAARSAAADPGGEFNPLFIHGGVGLGKSHLLQAAVREFSRLHPGQPVLYVTASGFVSEFVRAVEQKGLTPFRERYRSLAFLAIDDIHLLSGKERSQEEFFHTFNTLHGRRSQIIVSADAAPGELAGLSGRLVSRLGWGLAVKLEPPDEGTRFDILKTKAAGDRLRVEDDVLRMIARTMTGSIRELEGALIRIIAYASLSHRRVTRELTEELLRTTERPVRRQVAVDEIQKAVAQHFGLTARELLSRRRARRIAHPRQIGMYLSRKLTARSLVEIGEQFGGRDHSTVLHACDKIERERTRNDDLARALADIERSIDAV